MDLIRKNRKKKKGCARRSPLRVGIASRWLLLVAGVVALSVQSFIVKPHFHTEETASLVAVAEIESEAISAIIQQAPAGVPDEAKRDGLQHNEAPGDLDFSDCALCKTAHQNGQYLRPAAAVFSLSPSMNYGPIAFGTERILGTPKSFSRQSRAPPQV